MDETEIWKAIPDFDGYEASSLGRIRSYWGKRNRMYLGRKRTDPIMLNQHANFHGRLMVCISRNSKPYRRDVHRLVAQAFLGVSPLCTRHINGNHLDNRIENLVYGTLKENQRDRVAHGTSNRGERNGRGKFKEEDVRRIRELGKTVTQTAIAKQYGVHQSAICNILRRRNWGWLE